jgi:hypothetical protein
MFLEYLLTLAPVRVLRSARLLTRLARFVAGEGTASPPGVRVLFQRAVSFL